jgi:two-component system response regulator AtoC
MFNYNWPGNVRELENCIERAMVLSEGEYITANDLAGLQGQPAESGPEAELLQTCSLKEGKKIMEHYLINKVLDLTEGNKSKAAQLLEISYPSLLSKIKELDTR